MPFTDPIVADDVLVREAIQSADYVPGVSGWRIGADGTAELAELVAQLLRVTALDGLAVQLDSGAFVIRDGAGTDLLRVDITDNGFGGLQVAITGRDLFVNGKVYQFGDQVLPAVDVPTDLTGAMGADFTLGAIRVRRAAGHVNLFLQATYTGPGITATAGNIPDTTVCTLPHTLPASAMSCVWSDTNGTQGGVAEVTSAGVVRLRTSSASIATGAVVRVTASYVL